MKILYFLVLSVFFSACYQPSLNNNKKNENLKEIPLKYAIHVKIFKSDDYYLVKIRNPWDTTKILHSYILTEKTSNKNFSDFKDYTIIKTPVEKALIFTSLHASLIKDFGSIDKISSLCDVEYVLDEDLQNAVKSGKIKNLGSSMNPDVEKILLENPEIIMLSPYQNSGSFGLLGKTKIPLVECADYMENSPLAQAEWIKFYGLLFGKQKFADSLFASVESNYLELIKTVENITQKPKLLPNSLISSVWYMPTKNSTAAKFYLDAGFDYPFNYLDGFGTVPLNFETVFSRAQDADVWIVKYNRNEDYNFETFANENSNYQKFKAFKNKNIYHCNLSYVPYYDQTPFHPDRLLKDLIKISHPEMFDDYELRYFKKL